MVIYRYQCETCGYIRDVERKMSADPVAEMPCATPCTGMLSRVYGAAIQVFRPFTTSGIEGRQTDYTSASQRDAALAANKVTMDGNLIVRHTPPPPAVEKVDFNLVKKMIREGNHE